MEEKEHKQRLHDIHQRIDALASMKIASYTNSHPVSRAAGLIDERDYSPDIFKCSITKEELYKLVVAVKAEAQNIAYDLRTLMIHG